MVRRIHHVGIVVKRLTDAYPFYRDTLGSARRRRRPSSPTRACGRRLLAAGDSEIELLEPTRSKQRGGRFLARRGEGLHHVCFDVADVAASLRDLSARKVALLDPTPRPGLAGQIAFLHPKACAGVLVELATPDDPEREPSGAPLRLKRLVIGGREPKETASDVPGDSSACPEIAMNGGLRTMLAVGRGAVLVVPADEVGGHRGHGGPVARRGRLSPGSPRPSIAPRCAASAAPAR